MKRGVIPCILLLIFLSACTQYLDEPLQQRTEEPPTTIQQPPSKGMMTIESPSFIFAPPYSAIHPLNKLKVTITNTDTSSRKFKVTLQGIETVATLFTPRIITLQPDESKTVEVYFETKKGAKAGTYPATVILISEGEILETISLTTNVQKQEAVSCLCPLAVGMPCSCTYTMCNAKTKEQKQIGCNQEGECKELTNLLTAGWHVCSLDEVK